MQRLFYSTVLPPMQLQYQLYHHQHIVYVQNFYNNNYCHIVPVLYHWSCNNHHQQFYTSFDQADSDIRSHQNTQHVLGLYHHKYMLLVQQGIYNLHHMTNNLFYPSIVRTDMLSSVHSTVQQTFCFPNTSN